MSEERPITDLCDQFPDTVDICEPIFRDYGGRDAFSGRIVTIRTYEDNSKVRELLESDGKGRVLVVDGGGSLKCALLGGNLAQLAEENGWSGIILNACVRDRAELVAAKVGIKAVNHCPKKSMKMNRGDVGIPVSFAGVTFRPNDHVYSDKDGVIVSSLELN
jgi:regulator of ribonuclease activity A